MQCTLVVLALRRQTVGSNIKASLGEWRKSLTYLSAGHSVRAAGTGWLFFSISLQKTGFQISKAGIERIVNPDVPRSSQTNLRNDRFFPLSFLLPNHFSLLYSSLIPNPPPNQRFIQKGLRKPSSHCWSPAFMEDPGSVTSTYPVGHNHLQLQPQET